MKNSKSLFIVITIVGLILIIIGAGLLYFSRPKRTYELNLPMAENIKSISIQRNSENGVIEKQYTIEEFIDWLNENKKTTTKESISDLPINATNEINFDFNFKQGASRISVYERKDKYYLEQAYNGIYEISEEEYKIMDKLARSTINGSESVIDAVVVKVYEKSIMVMDLEDKSLTDVSCVKTGNIGFKQGQEVSIYFDGFIEQSYPAGISGVNKIEITKEKTDVQIPENILRICYSSRNNVKLKIDEFTKNGIAFTLTDLNKIKYTYSDYYKITKKNEEKRIWEESERNSDIMRESTKVLDTKINESTFSKKFDWTNFYGTLNKRRI